MLSAQPVNPWSTTSGGASGLPRRSTRRPTPAAFSRISSATGALFPETATLCLPGRRRRQGGEFAKVFHLAVAIQGHVNQTQARIFPAARE